MARIWVFQRGDEGSVTIEWMEIVAGIVTLGTILVYAIFNEGTASPTDRVSEAVASVNSGVDTGAAVILTASGTLQLTERVALPVGSVAVHRDRSVTVFDTPSGGWVDAWGGDGTNIPVGATLTSPDTFTLEDGRTVAASNFSKSYREAYASNVRYVFE
jgi:hypothetical protein